MIIDIHTHAFPDELAARAMEVLVGNSGVQPFADGTVAGLVESTIKAGIDRSIIAPIATKPAQVAGINKWAVEINKKYPQVLSFGTVHPGSDDFVGDIARLKADGLIGVKMHPDYQLFFVDEPAAIEMYKALAEAGIIALFHAGVDIGLPPPVHCTPDRLARVLDAVPNLKVIAAHMGGYQCWEDVDKYLTGRDLYFDTSYSLADLGPERLASMAKAHGIEKILFGTDSPWTGQAEEVAGIQSLQFTADEIDAVLGGNAARLLVVL